MRNPSSIENSLIERIDAKHAEICPRCGFRTWIAVGNQKICNQCGCSEVDKNPIASRAANARKDSVGFRSRGEK